MPEMGFSALILRDFVFEKILSQNIFGEKERCEPMFWVTIDF